MTSYSIFTPVGDDTDEVRECQYQSLLRGAARALLDEAEIAGADHSRETQTASASQWQSPVIGWELRAIHSDDRARVERRVRQVFDGAYADLTEVVAKIVRAAIMPHIGGRYLAWYRAGELLLHSTLGSGIGLWEYGEAGERAHKVAEDGGPIRAEANPFGHPEEQWVRLIEC